MAKVEHLEGEVLPSVGFIVTKLEANRRAAARSHNKWETAEVAAATIKEARQGLFSGAVRSC